MSDVITVVSLREAKKPLKYEVILSNSNKYIVDEEIVVRFRLVKGKELDDSTILELDKTMSYVECYKKAASYSLKYFKPSKEIVDYLIRKGYDASVARDVVKELKDKKVINDNDYKNEYLSHLVREGNGRLLISHKMKEKGFDSDYEINEEDYYNALDKLIKNKLKGLKDNKEIRIKRYLSQRGYTISEINEGLRGVSFE